MTAYLVAVLIVVLIYLLLSLGLTIQYGLTGLINFGLVGFFAIGAYVSALLAMNGVPLVALVPRREHRRGACRLADRIGRAAAARRLFRDRHARLFRDRPARHRQRILADQRRARHHRRARPVPGCRQRPRRSSPLACCSPSMWPSFFVLHRIVKSPFGRALEAVRDDETALTALGKSPSRFKIEVLILGSALAGLAGAFYGHYVTYIVPDQFVPLTTFYIWMAVIIGGVGRVSGADRRNGPAHRPARRLALPARPHPGHSRRRNGVGAHRRGRAAADPVHDLSPAGSARGFHQAMTLEIRNISASLGGVQILKDITLQCARGRHHRADRPERRGQVDAVQRDLGLSGASRRAKSGSAGACLDGPAPAERARAGHGAHLSGAARIPPPDGARKSLCRGARPARRAPDQPAGAAGARSRARARDPRARPKPFCDFLSLERSRTCRRASFPAARRSCWSSAAS